MKVFLKFIRKSMTEKKTQFILLLVAVILSSTLVVCSFGLTDVVKSTFTETFTKLFENRDINITAKNSTGLIKLNEVNTDGLKDLLPSLDLNGIYKVDSTKSTVNISAREKKYINKDKIIEGSKEDGIFTNNKAIISKRTADNKNFKLGDKIKVTLNGVEEEFEISNIYATDGPFYGDDTNFTLIVPYKYIADKLNIDGYYTTLRATSINGDAKETSATFNENNKDFDGSELVNKDMMEQATGMITNILMLLSSIVIFLSVIIIFSSFKLIVTERIPIIGTFLSQGATKFKVAQILIMESFLYGLIGGVLSFFLGSGLIKVIAYYTSPLKEYGIINEAPIMIKYLFISLAFGIGLSVLSSIIPILSIRKLPVKDVILGKYEASYKTNRLRFILGVILLVSGLLIYFLTSNITLGLFLLLFSFVLMMKKIVEVIASLLYLFFRDRAPIIAVAFNNVKSSKELTNSITIMLIAIISVTSITSVSSSLVDVVTGAYDSLRYDLSVTTVSTPLSNNSELIINEVLSKDSRVDKDSIQIMGTQFGNTELFGFPIMGIDEDKYREVDGYLDWENKDMKASYENLKDSREPSVLITKNLNKMFNVSEGDYVTISIGNNELKVKVVGIIDGKLMNNGFFMMMKNSTIRENVGGGRYEQITFKVNGDVDEIKTSLSKSLEKYDVRITSLKEQKENNLENNAMLINIISIFSGLAVIIAAFGLLNNMGISYLNSKKTLALLTSLGLSKGNKNRLLIYQGLIVVFFVGLLTIPFSLVVTGIMSELIKGLNIPFDIFFDISSMPTIILSLTFVTVLSTLPTLFKGKKLSVMEELKYE